MRNISAWLFRYEIQTYGYIFLLTGKYPSLAGGPQRLVKPRRISFVHFRTITDLVRCHTNNVAS